jgi:hypothetical protein
MPITWMRGGTRDVVTLTVTAPWTVSEWRTAIAGILQDAAGAPVHFLVDRREAGPVSMQLVREMIDYLATNATGLAASRAAIVVSGDDAYGMARMMATRTELRGVDMQVQVFRDFNKALAWLQLASR